MTLRDIVSQIMDEETYVANDPVLAAAVNAGEITAVDHFINHGLEEGRTNINPLYSENFYLSTYLDIAAAVTANAFFSGLHHYLTNITENRAPSETFSPTHYLDTYADIVAAGVIPILHFYSGGGMLEKRKANPETRLDNVTDPTFLAAHAAQDLSALANSIVQLSSSNLNNTPTIAPTLPPTTIPISINNNPIPVISTGIGSGGINFTFTAADNENGTGTDNDDTFNVSINPLTFNTNDSINGGNGNDVVLVTGGTFGSVVNFALGNVTNIEEIRVNDNSDDILIVMPSNLSVTATGGTGTDFFIFDTANKNAFTANDIFDGGTGDDDNGLFLVGGTGVDSFDITGAGALTNIQQISLHDGSPLPGGLPSEAIEILVANAASIAGLTDLSGGNSANQTVSFTDSVDLTSGNIDLANIEAINLQGSSDLTIDNNNWDEVMTITGSAAETNSVTIIDDTNIQVFDDFIEINELLIGNNTLSLDGQHVTDLAGSTGGATIRGSGTGFLNFNSSADLSDITISGVNINVADGSDITIDNGNASGIANNISGVTGGGNEVINLDGNVDLSSISFTDISQIVMDGNGVTVSNSISSVGSITGTGPDTITVNDPLNTVSFNATTVANISAIQASGNGETITGTVSGDTIIGLAGDNELNGDAGNDSLVAGDGNDTLVGGSGEDSIALNAGGDTDNIRYSNLLDGSSTVGDSITGFVLGEDKIIFTGEFAAGGGNDLDDGDINSAGDGDFNPSFDWNADFRTGSGNSDEMASITNVAALSDLTNPANFGNWLSIFNANTVIASDDDDALLAASTTDSGGATLFAIYTEAPGSTDNNIEASEITVLGIIYGFVLTNQGDDTITFDFA